MQKFEHRNRSPRITAYSMGDQGAVQIHIAGDLFSIVVCNGGELVIRDNTSHALFDERENRMSPNLTSHLTFFDMVVGDLYKRIIPMAERK